jgi:hypothetical protein
MSIALQSAIKAGHVDNTTFLLSSEAPVSVEENENPIPIAS